MLYFQNLLAHELLSSRHLCYVGESIFALAWRTNVRSSVVFILANSQNFSNTLTKLDSIECQKKGDSKWKFLVKQVSFVWLKTSLESRLIVIKVRFFFEVSVQCIFNTLRDFTVLKLNRKRERERKEKQKILVFDWKIFLKIFRPILKICLYYLLSIFLYIYNVLRTLIISILF